MRKATKVYATLVSIAIIPAIIALFAWRPGVSRSEVTAIAFLCALAVAAEMLAFMLSNNKARGSIAFIPYLAMVLIVPSWASILAVVLVKLGTESFAQIERIKATFNAVTHGLTLAIAIAVYLALGGTSLLEISNTSLSAITTSIGWQALVAYLVSFIINTFLVSVVISLETGESVRSVSREVSVMTIAADLLATPIVFIFSWIYAAFGAIAAAAAWVPIVGIRHVNRVNLELEQSNQELLQLMVKSIEARDPYTSGHSRRVSKYAVAIARSLNMRERDVQKVATAALLHDVGKIYEKYAPILRNPGRLTPAEWTTMQEHPVDGASLVATISRLKELVPAVRHHHENWDGSGYPDRIAGDAIPLASRIIMFADTIDAMTSERPYRGPLTEVEVRAEIVKGRGQQFDPQIADRLLAVGIWTTLFGPQKNGSARPALELVGTRNTA